MKTLASIIMIPLIQDIARLAQAGHRHACPRTLAKRLRNAYLRIPSSWHTGILQTTSNSTCSGDSCHPYSLVLVRYSGTILQPILILHPIPIFLETKCFYLPCFFPSPDDSFFGSLLTMLFSPGTLICCTSRFFSHQGMIDLSPCALSFIVQRNISLHMHISILHIYV